MHPRHLFAMMGARSRACEAICSEGSTQLGLRAGIVREAHISRNALSQMHTKRQDLERVMELNPDRYWIEHLLEVKAWLGSAEMQSQDESHVDTGQLVSNNFIVPHLRLLVGLSPKAGHTVVLTLLFRALGLLEEALAYDPNGRTVHPYRFGVYNRRLCEEFSPRYLLSFLTSQDAHRIKFVRNPFERAVSSYLQVHRNYRPGQPLFKAVQRDFGIGDMEWIDWSFREFLLRLAKVDRCGCDPHYRRQQFSYEPQVCQYSRYYKIEKLDDAIQDLEREFALNLKHPELLKQFHHTIRCEVDVPCVANLPFRELQSLTAGGNTFPACRHFYNRETTGLVTEIFRGDFELYGYSTEQIPGECYSQLMFGW